MYSIFRAGNSLMNFLSKLLVFCEYMSEWVIGSKNEQFAQKRAIRAFLVSNLSDSLMVAHRFSEQIACFFAKNERVSDLLKKRAIRSFAHFWWSTWVIRSHWSFWWTTWSLCSHCSLKKREWANRPFKKKKYIYKTYQNTILFKFFLSELLICLFIMSDLIESLMVAHFSWATWAICSRLLFWYERPERFAHSCSYVLSDLSESLTVAHLIWVIWANEQ